MPHTSGRTGSSNPFRAALLLLFDDAARDKVELKMINFGFSYALPDGQTTAHMDAWDGSATSHEDGYLAGVKSFHRLCKRVEAEQAAQNRSARAAKSSRRLPGSNIGIAKRSSSATSGQPAMVKKSSR